MKNNLNQRKTIKNSSITDKMIFNKLSCILKTIEEENKIIKMIIREKDNRIKSKIINPKTEIIDIVMIMIRIEIIGGRISIRKRIEIYLIIIGIQLIYKKDWRNRLYLKVFSFRRRIKKIWLRLNVQYFLRMFM